MPNHSFTFNGTNSLNMGIKVERFPTIIHARRKYERISVPGRNGDLLFPEEAFENYTQPYEVYAGDPDEWIDIVSWLMPYKSSVTVDDYINLTVNGYYQLTDTYEPDVIRLANYMEESDIANAWNKKGRTTLYFDCRPERFTSDAFTVVTKTSSGGYLTNNTQQNAKPFLKVYGSGAGALVVNGYVINISDMADYLNIDCESQNCFRLLAENRNSLITLTNGFPVLSSGRNYITWSGGVTSVDIYPRWWNL